MPQSVTSRQASETDGHRPYSDVTSDREFKEGYDDGRAGRSKAHYSDVYLEGYREGVLTASIGMASYRHPKATAYR